MEVTTLTESGGRDVTAGLTTLCAAFQATTERVPDVVALRLPAEGVEWTWAEYATRVRRAAAALHRLGVRRGDAVALLLSNRPEHVVADMAALHLGATPFTIYATSAPAQVEYIIGDSGARVLVTEAGFENTVAAVADMVEHVVTVTPGAPSSTRRTPMVSTSTRRGRR